jgi:hypothetical protein
MKIISNIKEVSTLQKDLAKFILYSCPWVEDDGWDPTQIGFIFILDDNDAHKVDSLCIAPHQDHRDDNYKEQMTINLESFDLWEIPSFYDKTSGYWNVVAVFGQEFGCAVFLSDGFVSSLPTLQARLQSILNVK